MTEKNEFLRRVEESFVRKGGGRLEKLFCEEFLFLQHEDQVAYARALIFAGCKDINIPLADNIVIPKADRIQAARIMLLRFYILADEPLWSSWLIDRMWDAVLEVPGGQPTDLFLALFSLLARFEQELPVTLGRFVQAITYNGYMRLLSKYEPVYAKDNFDWILEEADKGLNPSQAFLLVLAVPLEDLSPELCATILELLAEAEAESELWKRARGWALHILDSDD